MIVIKCEGLANGAECGVEGQYLEAYNPEAFRGRGEAVWTGDPARALQFSTMGAAFYFARQCPRNRLRRHDGKPNRPLLAFHLSFGQAPGEPEPLGSTTRKE